MSCAKLVSGKETRNIAQFTEQPTGGATRHWEAPVLKPIPVFKMMGRKIEMDVVTVMMKL